MWELLPPSILFWDGRSTMTALLLNPTDTSQLLTYLTSPQYLTLLTIISSLMPSLGFLLLLWPFFLCLFSWCSAWFCPKPSSHTERPPRGSLIIPTASLGLPKSACLACVFSPELQTSISTCHLHLAGTEAIHPQQPHSGPLPSIQPSFHSSPSL